jgi:AhpD family alkylhydroperoxidase
MASVPPRVAPGTRAQIGSVNAFIAEVAGAAIGTGPLNLFTTLGRHRRLFRHWLRFAGALMPGGVLPRADTELVILRVAHRAGCAYEWEAHERIAATVGLSAAQIAAVREGPGAAIWSADERGLLGAVDELQAERRLSEPTFRALRERYTDEQLIELLMLIGHYDMLAGVINGLGIQPDPPSAPRSAFARLLGRVVARRAS